MALLAARHSVSQARTSRFLPLTLLRELALEEIPECVSRQIRDHVRKFQTTVE